MAKVVLEAIVLLTLPTITLAGGAWILSRVGGRDRVMQLLNNAKKEDQKPLGSRLTYDVAAVDRQWKILEPAVDATKRLLELDLVFPFFYGSALAFSLALAWSSLGRPIYLPLILAPVLVAVFADWTENLIQLEQFNRYRTGGAEALQAGWIRIASTATVLKWAFLIGSLLLVFVLVVIRSCTVFVKLKRGMLLGLLAGLGAFSLVGCRI